MPKLSRRFRHPSLESTMYGSLKLDKLMTYGSFSRSLACKVDLRSLGSQYGINVDPVKSYFIVWQKKGCINFIIPIGGKEETPKDLSRLLQGADDLLSSV